MTRRRHPHVARPAALAVALGLVATSLAGCSDDATTAPGAEASSAPSATVTAAEPEPVATVASINRVDGDLADGVRDRLLERVQTSIDAWIDAAYAGAYPRDDFSAAFDTFTDGARARAADDAGLLSNAELGARLDGSFPLRRRVRIDVLGVEGHAAAVTARVDLAFELSGEVARTDRVTGELYLTYEKGGAGSGWRIFGYDLRRAER